MWTDNETELDFLNFTGVADTVAEIIVQAQADPISIGVAGAWGVGKSSMIRLIRRSLDRRESADFIFVEFNAWLYQGYDDARAALMEVIAETLTKEAEKRKKGTEKAKEFLERIRWFRLAKLVTGSAVALYAGIPPVGLLGELWGLGEKFIGGEVTEKTLTDAEKTADKVKETATGLIAPKKKTSPPKEIQGLRESFEETLSAMGVTLVVLIDDLDRCLPSTIYLRVAEGTFPRPISLGARAVGWVESEINDWLVQRIQRSRSGIVCSNPELSSVSIRTNRGQ